MVVTTKKCLFLTVLGAYIPSYFYARIYYDGKIVVCVCVLCGKL